MKKCLWLVIIAALGGIVYAEDAKQTQPTSQPAAKQTTSEDPFWQEEGDIPPKPTEEQVNQFLQQVRKDNAARADELEKLRKENTEEFDKQIRIEFAKQIRKQWDQGDRPEGPRGRGRSDRSEGPEGGPGPEGSMTPPPGEPEQPDRQQGRGSGRDWFRERMERMQNEFVAWLEKNYSEDAAALKALREKPDEYMAKSMELHQKYDKIMRTEKSNPKLAQAMKDDLELQKQRDAILAEIRKAEGAEKEKLIAALKDNIARRFDVIMTKKQLQYDDLKKRLEELKKEVKNRESELEKLKTTKNSAVEEHLKDLLTQAEKVEWN